MVPKYAGRLLDRLVLIVAKQTSNVRGNPEDAEYAVSRGTALETVTWSLWQARKRLQKKLQDEEQEEAAEAEST